MVAVLLGVATVDDADNGVRHLVLVHGKVRARAMVEPEKRPLVDIAAEGLADETGRIGISYSGFCLTSLPHKALADNESWKKRGHRVTLLVTPGQVLGPDGEPVYVGVPYGARARMILLYLQTRNCSTRSEDGLALQGGADGLIGVNAAPRGGADDGAEGGVEVGGPVGPEAAGDLAVGDRAHA